MSLTTTVGAGALLGCVVAFAVYSVAAPGEEPLTSAPAPTFPPVPTPTVTRTAEDCEGPAVLTKGVCVITRPGPTVVATDPAPRPTTTAPRTAPPRPAPPAADTSGDAEDDDDDHGDHEDEGHEDEGHEDEGHGHDDG